MKQHIALGLRLALFVAAVVAMLSVVNVLTRGTISQRQRLEGEVARSALMSGTFTEMTDFTIPAEEASTVTAVYRAEQDGVVVGYCFDVTVKGYNKTSAKVTKLKAKTKYFVKVRTYKTVKGKKIYSDWSKVKTIKTK